MKQNDTIETIKQNTFARYNTEDGIWDIMLGCALIWLALCSLGNMFSFFAFYGAFGPLLARNLKRKYVYPRIGVVLFRKYPKSHYRRVMMSAAFIILITILGVVFTLNTKPSPIISFSYSYPWGFIILLMFIAGGIQRDAKYYLYAFMMSIPIYFTHLFNTNTYYRSISVVLLILLLFSMEKLVKKDTNKSPKQIKQRLANFEHILVIILSVIAGIYLYMNMNNVPLANELRDFALGHLSLVIGNFVAVLLLVIGIAFLSYRFVLYGFLLSAMIFLPSLITGLQNDLMLLLLLLGVCIILLGSYILNKFIKKYPVLEAADER